MYNSFIAYMMASGIVLIFCVIAYRLLIESKSPPHICRKLLLTSYGIMFFLPLGMVLIPEGRHEGSIEIDVPIMVGFIMEKPSGAIISEFLFPMITRMINLVYFTGVFLMLIIYMGAMARLLLLKKNSKATIVGGIVVFVHHIKNLSSFSWLNKIFILSDALDDSEEGVRLLLLHEKSHLSQRHWIDLIIAQWVLIFQWFNPAAWYLRKELQRVHEYQADEDVLASGVEIKTYQHLLINNVAETHFSVLTDGLNNCSLKKRFLMMKKSNFGNGWKLGSIGMFGIILLSAFFFRIPEVRAMLKTFDYYGNDPAGVYVSEMKEFGIKGVTVTEKQNTEQLEVLQKSKRSKESIVAPDKDITEGERFTQKKKSNIRYFSENPEAYISVDKSAQYEGGDRQLAMDIRKAINYPPEALKEEKQGRVIVVFQINRDGLVSDCRVAYSPDEVFNEAAIKAVQSLPGKWTPGEVDGNPVNSIFNLPVIFRLPD